MLAFGNLCSQLRDIKPRLPQTRLKPSISVVNRRECVCSAVKRRCSILRERKDVGGRVKKGSNHGNNSKQTTLPKVDTFFFPCFFITLFSFFFLMYNENSLIFFFFFFSFVWRTAKARSSKIHEHTHTHTHLRQVPIIWRCNRGGKKKEQIVPRGNFFFSLFFFFLSSFEFMAANLLAFQEEGNGETATTTANKPSRCACTKGKQTNKQRILMSFTSFFLFSCFTDAAAH